MLRRMRFLRDVLERALTRLAEVGADPADDEEARLQKALLVLIAILILPISGMWAVLYLAFGGWTGWVAVIYGVVSIASIVLFARNRDFEMLLNIQLVDIALAPTLSMIPVGGFLPTGGVGLWGILAPLGALVFRGPTSGIRWFVAWLALFLGSGIAAVVLDSPAPLPEWFSNVMLALNISVGGTIVFTLLALFARQRSEALAALRVEQRYAENLLLNILPGSIAERLKSNPRTIADQIPAASVLFADVVDFTPRSEELTAPEVVGLLDRLFSHFDELAERHGLEKIKTIGDAYMVASGVPEPRPDHAQALARLALEMVAAMGPGGAVGDLRMQLRVGINSGPVVAGVIGRKRFLYDLWGDAVNTASRMESHGVADRIQVTRATYELLRDEFVLEPRGTVTVKGKGELETWYLVGPKGVTSGS
ncbi:MAG: adenylate/guanylate cyclase domain-containing protein [Chloroflexi bacterium]|nr:adenylate/guanylate cyclase domain-containing protein [Chloroflexota bacterium]